MNHFPIFADLRDRAVLVVGGGAVAARKAEMLLRAGAVVRVASPHLKGQMQRLHEQKRIIWVAQMFEATLLEDVYLVVAASSSEVVNRTVFDAAEARNLLANVVDSPSLCSFMMPAVVNRSPIQVAISSGGTAPVLARLLREKIEQLLPQQLGAVAKLAERWREKVKHLLPNVARRRYFWEKLFTDSVFIRLIENGRTDDAETVLTAHLQDNSENHGIVSLVGAGPGDADLLTIKALRRIQEADVVLYDALVSSQVMDLIRRDAHKIAVGKRAGQHSVAQEETNRLLKEYALQGKKVVRLKGGDPFVFGRGGEEAEILADAGIPFEIVPGITAALGATAYAGVPLTHRDYSQTVVFVTGHCRPDGHELDWATLARGKQTLAVYMGTIKAAELTEQLIRHGRSADTPVVVISKGTLPEQTVLSGVLVDLPKLASLALSPALMVIGETAALHGKLNWFGDAAVSLPSICEA